MLPSGANVFIIWDDNTPLFIFPENFIHSYDSPNPTRFIAHNDCSKNPSTEVNVASLNFFININSIMYINIKYNNWAFYTSEK